jgi:N-acetylmuramoyl-L-alanine amidase
MKLPLSRDSESRVRQELLRGVYEENLRIVGKQRGQKLTKRRHFFLNRVLFVFLLIAVGLLMQGNSLTGSFPPAGQPAPRAIASPPAIPDHVRPADYRPLMGNSAEPVSRIFGLGVKTIMIDPGHGGNDPGTTGKLGTKEKDMTLDIARRLKDLLQRDSRFKILMTRDQDIAVPLRERVQMAIAEKADLFISIHFNYLPSKPINIIETYYFGPSSDAKTLRLAEQENAGSQFGLSDFKSIIEKIGDTVKLQESRLLAASIQRSLYLNSEREKDSAYDYGVKRAPFVVLLGADVPAVLAEVSCLSNKAEERRLNTETHRENIARSLEAGILDYLNKGEAIYEANGRPEGK